MTATGIGQERVASGVFLGFMEYASEIEADSGVSFVALGKPKWSQPKKDLVGVDAPEVGCYPGHSHKHTIRFVDPISSQALVP